MSKSTYEPVSLNQSRPSLECNGITETYSDSPAVEVTPQYTEYSSKSLRGTLLYICAILILSGLLIYQAVFPSTRQPHLHTGREFGGCGDSTVPARAIGCRFEPMSWQWIPEQCYYTDLVESFLSRTDWHFYRNYTLDPADEIDMEEILNGDHEIVFTPDKYHPIHCTYEWIKLHKAFVEKLPIDNIGVSLDHTHHCGLNVLNPYLGELGVGYCTNGICATQLSVTFNTCGYY